MYGSKEIGPSMKSRRDQSRLCAWQPYARHLSGAVTRTVIFARCLLQSDFQDGPILELPKSYILQLILIHMSVSQHKQIPGEQRCVSRTCPLPFSTWKHCLLSVTILLDARISFRQFVIAKW